jgi:hypothetical protein
MKIEVIKLTMALAFLLCCAITQSMAQGVIDIKPKTPYYFNINTASKSETLQIQEGLLHLQYEDKFGAWKELPLQLYDGEMKLLGNFKLNKRFGLNNFSINLNSGLSKSMAPNKLYHCMVQDESGKTYEWTIKSINRIESDDFFVNIFVKPKEISCDKPLGNLVEFYADIKNGRYPYSVRWYVVNLGKTDFLYQPKEDIIVDSESTSAIMVDKAPAYYVILDVTDACGTNSKKMVFLDCEPEKKRISSIFVTPFDPIKNKNSEFN